MATHIYLDNTPIQVVQYKQESVDGLQKVSIDFEVTSEMYHDTAVLLYQGAFHVRVPEDDIAFYGTIVRYSTSLTNLYEQNQTALYSLELKEGDPNEA
ncbi:hypothetical protein JCM19037_278 [Geomicrobium sp. JCM 19037]|uniref:DUF3219 family protein n=1 Tax=Geomicrobium sp. JCM 19037 TaxID=1460634 RepID=UPI00045F4ACF|nr:DUF3219 family protein [Geomicrobium sp. JCM 19037]GAK02076.1 hypothetical protein JCM19037_278 [Geomicrobium sp. JCM 19037]